MGMLLLRECMQCSAVVEGEWWWFGLSDRKRLSWQLQVLQLHQLVGMLAAVWHVWRLW